MLPVHLEAHEVSRLSPLLSRGASVSERIGFPLELMSILVIAFLSMLSRTYALIKPKLAPAAHEDTRLRVKRTAPLVLARLLGGVPLPLPAAVGQTFESAWS